ncbi:MAG: hypothetical protein OIF38_11970, partial [Cellvibrionaceae bacterium]|nr:hypothetical protein [Cellvibrionaceae bacterium]
TDKPNKIYFITLCALSLLLNGPCLYIFVQDLSVYGGISGLVTAVVFYWALQYYQAKGFKGLLGKFLIFALPLKIATEWKLSSSAIELFGSQDFYTVSLAHVTGLISAVLTYALRHWRQSWSGKAN